MGSKKWTLSKCCCFISSGSSVKNKVGDWLSHTLVQWLLFSHKVVSNSLRPHGVQHARLPCPSLSPRVCSNSCPSSWWHHPSISSSVVPFSCLPSFPASRSFPMSRLFASGGQSIGVSVLASVLPMNIQGWFPLGLTGLIFLDSQESSPVYTLYWKTRTSGLIIERLVVDFKWGRWLCKGGDHVSETTWVKVWMKMCMSFQGPWDSKMRKTVPLHSVHRNELSSYLEFFFLKNFLFCVGVEPINNVEVVLGGQQRDSAIQTHVSILPQAPSPPGFHMTLNRVPCALR